MKTFELDRDKQRRNRTVALACAAFFFCMIGVAYAAVPLYQLFCQVTGYGGTTQRVEEYSQTVLDREITVRFDANVSGGLAWEFQPIDRHVTMNIGETTQVAYRATNAGARASTGRATFNVTPELAGAYFMKVECFCFTDQRLQPGQSMDMPIVFYVDPEIVNVPELKDIETITLSYTFFHADEQEAVTAQRSDGSEPAAESESGG